MKLVVLCGGKGSRLKSVVSSVPKPLAPVGNSNFLEILLKRYERAGFSDVIISTGYMADKISDFIDSSKLNMNATVVQEQKPLGTGGAVRLVIDQTEYDGKFLVVNGDTLIQDLPAINFFENNTKNVNFALFGGLKPDAGDDRYGKFYVTRSGHLSVEQDNSLTMISYGIYLIDPVKYACAVELEQKIDLDQVYRQILLSGKKIHAIELNSSFVDIGVPEDYRQFKEKYENSLS